MQSFSVILLHEYAVPVCLFVVFVLAKYDKDPFDSYFKNAQIILLEKIKTEIKGTTNYVSSREKRAAP